MNTPSPLIPQGALPVKGKSTIFFKVLMILTVHFVLIGGMLLQGCKDTKDTSSNPAPDTAATTTDTLPPVTPAAVSNAQAGVAPAPPQVPPTNLTPPVVQAAPSAPLQPPAAPPMAPPAGTEAGAREYVIASGDTLGAIAHKNGISLKALLEANAGVNPKKLQIGQKIQIPAGAGVAAATAGPASPDVSGGAGDTAVYTVKPGDTLSKIAKVNHTTFKKIMALNDLKTTSIRVGQKLKLPAPRTATTEIPVVPTTPVVPLQTAPPPVTTAAAPSVTSSN